MLESEAKTKLCPLISCRNPTKGDGTACVGSKCMGWDEWKKYDGGRDTVNRQLIPHDPPQGDCGMKSKDLELP